MNNKIIQSISKLSIDDAVSIINIIDPVKWSPNLRYTNKDFFICMMDFVKKGTSWRKYIGTREIEIKGTYLNKIHNRWVQKKVYEKLNKEYLSCYLKTNKEKKIKIQCIDSSFIPNKGGSVNTELLYVKDNDEYKHAINFCRYNGRKKYLKISTITDSFGTPFTSLVVPCKKSETRTIKETIDAIPVNLNTSKNSKNNRYKQIMLGDSGYCSKYNRSLLTGLGYRPLIRYNKRATKNKELLKSYKMSKKDALTYKKRIIIESTFSWLKNFPTINQNYQKTIKSFNGLLLLASSILISSKT